MKKGEYMKKYDLTEEEIEQFDRKARIAALYESLLEVPIPEGLTKQEVFECYLRATMVAAEIDINSPVGEWVKNSLNRSF